MPLNFNSDDLNAIESPSNKEFAPLPDGKFCASVVSATDEQKTSAAGHDYECVNIQFRIVKGDHENRRVFKRYIYNHANSPMAADIGKKGLKALWLAQGGEGNLTPANLEKDVCVEIVLKTPAQGSNGYEPRQEVTFVNPCKEKCDVSGAPAPSVDADDIF